METNGKHICKEWNRLAFHFKPIHIFRLVTRHRKTKRTVEDVTILKAGRGDSPDVLWKETDPKSIV
jgi:hypothetical protein